jgi:hypothetical protein
MAAPLTEPSLLGVLLASRYEIRALLGRGGMGEVFEAVDRRLHRTVAVKVLRPELAADERFLARFRREASTAAGLAHPGIVAVHDVGEDGGRTFIVMEFVAGRTLADLTTEPALDSATVARIGGAAARALAHAHDRGVVHRDVSPANVMMTADGAVKVLDFGIARDARSLRPDAAATHGTLAYLAPEVIRGGPVDARADVFALGAVLAELTRRTPSPSPELDAVLARATATRPEDRFVSASAMAEALERPVDRAPARAAHAPSDPDGASGRTAPIPRISTRPLPVVGTTPAGLRPVRGISVPRVRRRGSGRLARTVVGAAIVGIAVGGAVMLVQSFGSLAEPQSATSVVGPPPVPAPDGLAATASCDGLFSTAVDLAWTGATPVKGYEIWRRGGSDGRLLVARLRGAHATVFHDADLGVDASYAYRVRAFDGPRVSEWSNRVEVATPFLCLA